MRTKEVEMEKAMNNSKENLFEQYKYYVECWINNYFKDKGAYNKKLYEAMLYSLNAGGKRIRPILMILTYKMYKQDYKNILPLASALEMIHTYSLIHDDLPCMDNDDLRRGKPTNHKVFGDAVAVLAGDGLLNEAFNVMFAFCSTKGSSESIKACSIISQSSGAEGMVGGQIVDILSENRTITLDELNYMHKKKTGALIKASIISGAVLANAPSRDVTILSDFGEKLGLAFQIKDDILDAIGDTSVLGKAAHHDKDNDKTTFISEYGIEECKKKCMELTNICLGLLKDLSYNTNELQQLTLYLLKRNL